LQEIEIQEKTKLNQNQSLKEFGKNKKISINLSFIYLFSIEQTYL